MLAQGNHHRHGPCPKGACKTQSMNKHVNKGFGLGGYQCYEGNKRVVLEQPPLDGLWSKATSSPGRPDGQTPNPPLLPPPDLLLGSSLAEPSQGQAWESVDVSNQVSFPGSGQDGEGWSSVWRVKQDTSHIEPCPSARLKSFISSSLPTGSQGCPHDPSVPTPAPTPISPSSLGNFSWFPQSIRPFCISKALPQLLPPPRMPSPHPHLGKPHRTVGQCRAWKPGFQLCFCQSQERKTQ